MVALPDFDHNSGGGVEEELSPDVFAVAALGDGDDIVVALRRDSGGLFDVGETEEGFFFGIGGSVEDFLGFAESTLEDEPPRRLGHRQDPHGQEDCRNCADSEHESPSEVQWKLGERVV